MKTRFNIMLFLILIIPSVFVPLENISALWETDSVRGEASGSPASSSQQADDNVVNFFQIQSADIQLVGPFDSEIIPFGLPAAWGLTDSPLLNLDIIVSLSALSGQGLNGQSNAIGGSLSVEYNRQHVGTFPLTQNGEVEISLTIPLSYTESVRDDGRQELVFVLDGGVSCLINQQMSVTIKGSSFLVFPHESVQPDLDLKRFPFPIYQGSIYPDAAVIVLPDEPTRDELQSAMVVSSGLGRLTGLRLVPDTTTLTGLSEAQKRLPKYHFSGQGGFPGDS